VVFRDILIVGGLVMLYLLGHPVAVRPLPVSKLTTALQIGLVAYALLLSFAHWMPREPAALLLEVLIWAVTAGTLASGAMYVWNAVRGR
jgi:cardiolipin synthase